MMCLCVWSVSVCKCECVCVWVCVKDRVLAWVFVWEHASYMSLVKPLWLAQGHISIYLFLHIYLPIYLSILTYLSIYLSFYLWVVLRTLYKSTSSIIYVLIAFANSTGILMLHGVYFMCSCVLNSWICKGITVQCTVNIIRGFVRDYPYSVRLI